MAKNSRVQGNPKLRIISAVGVEDEVDQIGEIENSF